ncbi:hypothetical protein BDY21DRAFT_79306 [Lineolata rhizophorae]|uniref:Uncharacterized protein n=1 Tax=Lineolata rhizophorae TaxID=578093 RepID=A0A6A6NU68_9PEZI|nr:hypothetical protein BDY21DRAFT_79306 [Lineolata rhizophorae]
MHKSKQTHSPFPSKRSQHMSRTPRRGNHMLKKHRLEENKQGKEHNKEIRYDQNPQKCPKTPAHKSFRPPPRPKEAPGREGKEGERKTKLERKTMPISGRSSRSVSIIMPRAASPIF